MIDFHCHLDLYPEPEKVADAAERAGVYVLSVTTTPKAFRRTAALGKGKRHIRTALGLHPQLAHERKHELPLFEALLGETRYVGEIGLDGTTGYGQHADDQQRVFETVLTASKECGNKIFSIHSRRAAGEVIATLSKLECAHSAVLHWFSGTHRQLANAVAAGCWFSVGIPMLETEKGRRLVASMPPHRVLTETDGPFGRRGNRPLQPIHARETVAALARVWKIDPAETATLLNHNLRELLRA